MSLSKDIHPDTLSRLSPLDPARLDAVTRKLYEATVSPSDERSRTIAGLKGPTGIFLHGSCAAALIEMNRSLRFDAGLDPKLRELAILVTARAMNSQFEWTAHEPVAERAGLSAAVIEAVKHRRDLDGPEDYAALVRYGRELFEKGAVSDDTYAAMTTQFGEKRTVDLTALMGAYAMTAYILRAFAQQLPAGQRPLLPV